MQTILNFRRNEKKFCVILITEHVNDKNREENLFMNTLKNLSATMVHYKAVFLWICSVRSS